MVFLSALLPAHWGEGTVAPLQKSAVVPQNPNLLQHTFKGQVDAFDHCAPQPGSHSLL
jgi:hypothetical protein